MRADDIPRDATYSRRRSVAEVHRPAVLIEVDPITAGGPIDLSHGPDDNRACGVTGFESGPHVVLHRWSKGYRPSEGGIHRLHPDLSVDVIGHQERGCRLLPIGLGCPAPYRSPPAPADTGCAATSYVWQGHASSLGSFRYPCCLLATLNAPGNPTTTDRRSASDGVHHCGQPGGHPDCAPQPTLISRRRPRMKADRVPPHRSGCGRSRIIRRSACGRRGP